MQSRTKRGTVNFDFFSKKYTIHHQKCTYIQTARARSRVRFDTFRTDQSLPWHPLIYISVVSNLRFIPPNPDVQFGFRFRSLKTLVRQESPLRWKLLPSNIRQSLPPPFRCAVYSPISERTNFGLLGESTAFQSAFGYISPLPMADFKHQRAMYLTGNMWRTKDKYH